MAMREIAQFATTTKQVFDRLSVDINQVVSMTFHGCAHLKLYVSKKVMETIWLMSNNHILLRRQ